MTTVYWSECPLLVASTVEKHSVQESHHLERNACWLEVGQAWLFG